MKILIITILAAIGLTASAQTNVYISTLISTNAKSQITCPTKYFYVSKIRFKPDGTGFPGAYYRPGAASMSLTFTNPNVRLQAFSTVFGQVACGTNHIEWTDPQWTNALDGYQFEAYVSNSVPWWPDTNDAVSVTAVGFTNAP